MTELDRTFAALADPTRRAILARLAGGEATVQELVAQFDLTQPTISAHLKVLQTAGLVLRSRKAQTRPCRLNPAGIGVVEGWLKDFRAAMEANYTRLDALLEELKRAEASPEETEK